MTGYPGPFRCPDCGTWWAGFEHRCSHMIKMTDTSVTYTAVCICAQKRGTVPEPVICPVHDIQVTYTTYGTTDATS